MDHDATVSLLTSLSIPSPSATISSLPPDTFTLLRTPSNLNIALLHRNKAFDILVLGSDPDCPIPSLRSLLDSAILPLSDLYASSLGVALPERHAVRNRLRAAAVALDVIAKGRLFSVPPPVFSFHPKVVDLVQRNGDPEELCADIGLINALQANVVAWSREINRIVGESKGQREGGGVEEETVFWSSLDSALEKVEQTLARNEVKLTLDILKRNRRATGFLVEMERNVQGARRKAAVVLELVKGLPLVSLRTAESLNELREGVTELLKHIAGKLRGSIFSIERILALVDAMGGDVSRSVGRILTKHGGILQIPFKEFAQVFDECCSLFEAWATGFDHCRKVARESARKKGESMPKRKKSPMVRLHLHLSEIFELRAHHEDLKLVFQSLGRLSPKQASTIKGMDLAYEKLVKSTVEFDHFNLKAKLDESWSRVSEEYKVGLRTAEKTAARVYQNAIQNETLHGSWSRSPCQFRRIVDKPFMSAAVAKAVPIILSFGKRELLSFLNQEDSVKTGNIVNSNGAVPETYLILSEYQILNKRAAKLADFIVDCVGQERTSMSSDLQDFLIDVRRFQERMDPVTYFTQWLSKINFNLFDSRFFTITGSKGGVTRMEMTIESEEILFFKVVAMVQDDADLGGQLKPKHLELSRACRSKFPVYCNLNAAISNINKFNDLTETVSDCNFAQILSFFYNRRSKLKKALVDGIGLQWSDSVASLLNYSTNLFNDSSALLKDMYFILEVDSELKASLEDIATIEPKIERGLLASSASLALTDSLRRFLQAAESLQPPSFNSEHVHEYIDQCWSSNLRRQLADFYKRLSSSWVSAMKSGNLTMPTVTLDVTHRTSGSSLVCIPHLTEIEQKLFSNFGALHDQIGESLKSCTDEAKTDAGKDCLISAHGSYASFLFDMRENPNESWASPFVAVRLCMDSLVSRANRWQHLATFPRLDISALRYEVESDLVELIQSLEDVTGTFEKVISLATISGNGESEGVPMDFSSSIHLDHTALAETITQSVREVLTKLCKQGAVIGSECSQQVYETISNTRKAIVNHPAEDTSHMLASLQELKDNVMPRVEATVDILTSAEKKFSEIAERIGDDSFSVARRSETWILSEELTKHLQHLHEAFEQRMQSLLEHRSFLLKAFEERESSYQNDVASIFSEFQLIRGSQGEGSASIKTGANLDSLERRLEKLGHVGLDLERISRALGVPRLVESNGLDNILTEIRRVKDGVQKLSILDNKISTLSQVKLQDAHPDEIRERLEAWRNEVDQISSECGIKGEGNTMQTKILSLLKVNSLLGGLQAADLSPPRERDVIHNLFGNEFHGSSLGNIPLIMFWEVGLQEHAKYLREVFDNAAAENAISEYLKDIERCWVGRKCSFAVHASVPLLTGIPDLIDELDEHLQGLDAMQGSAHARLFETDRLAWEQKLSGCKESLELLSDVQSRWSYLESLFGGSSTRTSRSIQRELQDEFAMLSNVQARLVRVGKGIQAAPGLFEGCSYFQGLVEMSNELASIVRGLSSYLEKERGKFPRFFFLSDGDLLNVLSISHNEVDRILPFVGKLFPGLSAFVLKSSGDLVSILSVLSKEKEELRFINPISILRHETVSTWLFKVQNEMSHTLQQSLPYAIQHVSSWYEPEMSTASSVENVSCTPMQIMLVALKICFTSAVEKRLLLSNDRTSELMNLKARVEGFLSRGDQQTMSEPSSTVLTGLATNDQFIKEFLYQKDVIQRLIRFQVKDTTSWLWRHEIRMYSVVDKDDLATDIEVCCGESTFSYGWEYLGVGETLVHTRLTSQCFLTLTEALRRGLGGSPFGPAGTGKTETVKALGRHMGRFVAVFNCDESFDSVAVGRILAGACRIGCWVCFDEFNRLSSSILSTTSGQLASLQACIQRGFDKVSNFYGGELPIAVKEGVAVFVTMNPNYAGRRELPASLKSLFRPCAMSKPDVGVITEVLFLSQRFVSYRTLSKKLVSLFENFKAILTMESRYDFGLRTLKSAIYASGKLLASATRTSQTSIVTHEENIAIRALGDIVKPKLSQDDVKAYENSISTVFLQASCHSSEIPPSLQEAVIEIARERGLVMDSYFLEKITQMYSLMLHQNAVIAVGQTGTGKTTAWETLHGALQRIGKEGEPETGNKSSRGSLTVMNPKLLSSQQMFGELDSITREWSDGLFTKTLRELSNSEEPADHFNNWIVFDGDIDPDWAENLNSVLDDNRILTLPTGEQISLPSNTKIVFETDSLQHTNPSTISRCGMVCFGFSDSQDQIFKERLVAIVQEFYPTFAPSGPFLEIVDETLRIARETILHGKLIIQVPLQSLLDTILRMIRASALHIERNDSDNLTEQEICEDRGSMNRIITKHFLIFSVKGISAGLSRADQNELTKQLFERIHYIEDAQSYLVDISHFENLAEVYIGNNGCVHEFTHLAEDGNDIAMSREDISSPDFVIPTPTTLKMESFFNETLNFRAKIWKEVRPLVLCGPPGCGKSMLLTAAMKGVPNISLATLSFSSETKPENILAALRGHTTLQKRTNGGLYLKPKTAGCRVVLFCDEVNLERPDKYGSQRTVAFLRSMAEHQGFWHGTPPVWVSLQGIQIVAACNPEEDAGRHKLPTRFLKLCTVVRVEQPSERDLHVIYRVFVGSLLRNIHPDLQRKVNGLTSAMIQFYSMNKTQFCPTRGGPLEPHYVYSPRDLSRWIRGMQISLSPKSLDGATQLIPTPNSSREMWTDVVSSFCYEARRIFSDRLLRESERRFVEDALATVVHDHLDEVLELSSSSLFTSWLCNESNILVSNRIFQPVEDHEKFRRVIYQKLRSFSEEHGLGGSWIGGTSDGEETHTMIDQFAVTDDVLTHLTRLERVLCQPLGHAVVMGAPGTGKKTLARFAAWMLSMDIFQVYSHSSYSEVEFANDLRSILIKVGVHNIHVMMIFDESNAMDSAFLEMMNSILACGDVPGLFSGEDRVQLLNALKGRKNSNGMGMESEQALYSEFVKRVRHNLHIVFIISTGCSAEEVASAELSRSSAGGDIGERSPALYNRCTVDWMGDWSKQTLEAVADLKIEVAVGHEKDKIIQCAVQIHDIARIELYEAKVRPGATPRHYLEFVEQLNRIALEKGDAIQNGVDRHTEGLRRLKDAGDAVDTLKDHLLEKTERLQKQEQKAADTLQNMIEEQRLAEKSKVEAESLAQAAKEASLKCREREDVVSSQLAEVEPKVEAAREAVGGIRKEYLEELRGMPNPPSGVRIALEGVIMLLNANADNRKGDAQISWGSIRSKMRGSDFIASVVNFDLGSLSSRTRARIEKRILNNPDFDVDRISYASRVAGPLAQWTISVLDYAAAVEAVEPLQREIEDLQADQEELVDRQHCALRDVDDLQLRIEECRSQYAELVAEAERLRQEITNAENNLQRAEDMLDSLADEWKRWVHELNSFNSSAMAVWGNALCAAAFIAYAGPLDTERRSSLLRQWRGVLSAEEITFDDNLKMSSFFTSQEERGLWSALGLPTDHTSLENFAILRRSARFPLIVDPNRESPHFLRCILSSVRDSQEDKSNQKGVVQPRISESSFLATGKNSYLRALESALRFGSFVLLEDSEKFDRAVVPLLGHESCFGDSGEVAAKSNVVQKGERRRKNSSHRLVRLGDRDVYLNSGFRMFLATADIGSVPVAAVTRANVVTFELSPAALKARCATKALGILEPSLEKRRTDSLAAKVGYEQKKRKLENDVLSAITNVENLGAELLRGPLLDTLQSLKEEVRLLGQEQVKEEQANSEIVEIERSFEILGDTALDIFQVLSSMYAHNPLYLFRVSSFLELYKDAISSCKKISSLNRIEVCQKALFRQTYSKLASSLFPRDRLAFSAALGLLYSCQTFGDSVGHTNAQKLSRIRDELKLVLKQPGKFHEYSSITDDTENMVPHTNAVETSSKPQRPKSDSTLDKLSAILRSAIEAPHVLMDKVEALARSVPESDRIQAEQFESEGQLNMILRMFSSEKGHESSKSLYSPLLLCARGENCDPAALVNEYGNQLKLSLLSTAMGDRQTPSWITKTFSTISRQSLAGSASVVLLKNIHLASRPALERIEAEILKQAGKLPFLLIMAAEVSSNAHLPFYSAVLPFCKSLAFESRPSLRENFSSAISKVSFFNEQKLEPSLKMNNEMKRLCTALCWLHACIQERSVHCPKGFSRTYQFTESDLAASWDIASTIMLRCSTIEEALPSISNMLTCSVYGGKVEGNDADVVKAVVHNIWNLLPRSLGKDHVDLYDNGTDDNKVSVPLNDPAKSRYVGLLPLQAPPVWPALPADTAKRHQELEGRRVVETLLRLSEQKFKELSIRVDEQRHSAKEIATNASFKELQHCMEILSNETDEAIELTGGTQLDIFIEQESKNIVSAIKTVRKDLRLLLDMEETTSLSRSTRTRSLEKHFLENYNSVKTLPAEWVKLETGINHKVSVQEFSMHLCRSLQELKKLAISGRQTIKLSNIQRPSALFAALKFSEAKKCDVVPFKMHALVSRNSTLSENSRPLDGIELRGARWDDGREIFVADGEGKEGDLHLNWQLTDSEDEEGSNDFVEVPLYNAGSTVITFIRIPVDCSNIDVWRLCGASLWIT